MSLVTKILGILILLLSFVIAWAWMDYQRSLTMSVISEQSVSFEIEKATHLARLPKN
jgi:hypothetical protein